MRDNTLLMVVDLPWKAMDLQKGFVIDFFFGAIRWQYRYQIGLSLRMLQKLKALKVRVGLAQFRILRINCLIQRKGYINPLFGFSRLVMPIDIERMVHRGEPV